MTSAIRPRRLPRFGAIACACAAVAFGSSGGETPPAVRPGGRAPAGDLVRLEVPGGVPHGAPVEVVDPWGQVLWRGAVADRHAEFVARDWADGAYTARFGADPADTIPFRIDSAFFEAVRARAGLLLREIDRRCGPDGLPPEALRGAADLLQRVVTEHVHEKRDDEISGNLHFGELAVGFRTTTMTARLLGTGAADYMDGYADPYAPGRREASSLFVPPNAVVDFSAHGERRLERWGLSFRDIEHVFISHSHGDHFHPGAIVRLAGRRQAANLPAPVVHGNAAVIGRMRAALEEAGADAPPLDLDLLEPGRTTVAGDLRVTAVLANHTDDAPPLCYIIRCRDAVLWYGTDTGYPPAATLDALEAERFDLFVHELTAPSAEDTIQHMDVGDLRRLLDRLRAAGAIDSWTRVVTFHQSRTLDRSLHDRVNLERRIGFESGYDGMPLPVAVRSDEPISSPGEPAP